MSPNNRLFNGSNTLSSKGKLFICVPQQFGLIWYQHIYEPLAIIIISILGNSRSYYTICQFTCGDDSMELNFLLNRLPGIQAVNFDGKCLLKRLRLTGPSKLVDKHQLRNDQRAPIQTLVKYLFCHRLSGSVHVLAKHGKFWTVRNVNVL